MKTNTTNTNLLNYINSQLLNNNPHTLQDVKTSLTENVPNVYVYVFTDNVYCITNTLNGKNYLLVNNNGYLEICSTTKRRCKKGYSTTYCHSYVNTPSLLTEFLQDVGILPEHPDWH